MKVLITGGAGFIGSNVVATFLKNGISVEVVDDLSNGHRQFISQLNEENLYICDFADEQILECIRGKSYDAVVHLAAIPRVSYSVEFPLETHNANVTSTLKLLDACRGNVKRFVFASSSSVYGGADLLPTPTTVQKNPKSPYALQKLIIENYMKLYQELYGLDSVALRFFNVFGPNQLGDSPYSTAVSSWLHAIFSGKRMRSDGDGTQTRDMCYVDNVADACLRSVLAKNAIGAEALNVACGDRVSNKEILEYLLHKFPEAQYYSSHWRPGDVMHTQADISRTIEVLGYKPLVTFWQGLDKTVTWYNDNWHEIKKLTSKQ